MFFSVFFLTFDILLLNTDNSEQGFAATFRLGTSASVFFSRVDRRAGG